MAKKIDREAMAAALGGMVSRPKPEPEEASRPKPGATEAGRGGGETESVAPVRTVAPIALDGPEPEEGEGHRRTGTGYVKADGTEMVRTVLVVTRAERRRLKALALEAGVSSSDYVRRALGFI